MLLLMRVVAIIALRNEERVLGRTLEHLAAQEVDVCLIDNGSTDGSAAIARSFLGRGVFRLETLPFDGSFNMPELMALKERLTREIEADWFLHQDADEIRQAPREFATLREGFAEMDRLGFNAVEFQEFVFLPTVGGETFEGRDFVAAMRHYYYFLPQAHHRLNAWKNTGQLIDLHTHWGHRVEFEGRRIAPVPFILRHYMALSRAHALGKYGGRIHSAPDIEHRGWKDARVNFQPDKLHLPTLEQLKTLDGTGTWDTSDPWPAHRFISAVPIRATPKPSEKRLPAPIPETPAPATKSWLPGWLSFGRGARVPTRGKVAQWAPMPVIVGAARSGTTLLRMMLDSHPLLAIPPETHFLPALRALQTRHDLKSAEHSETLKEEFFRVLTGSLNWKEFGLEEAALREAVSGGEGKAFSVRGGVRKFYRLYARARGKARWGDKTPPYVTQLKEVQALLPEVHFIHLIRDGRDVALSMRGLWFDAARGNLEDQAANWVWRIREARQQAAFCAHYLEVRYEELLAEPGRVLERISEFLALEHSPAMEAYHRTAGERLHAEIQDRHDAHGKVTVSKAQREAIFEKVGQPPDQERAGRWRREMSGEERAGSRRWPAVCCASSVTRWIDGRGTHHSAKLDGQGGPVRDPALQPRLGSAQPAGVRRAGASFLPAGEPSGRTGGRNGALVGPDVSHFLPGNPARDEEHRAGCPPLGQGLRSAHQPPRDRPSRSHLFAYR